MAESEEDKKFRFSAKSVFLTYSRCPIEKKTLQDFLLLKHAWTVLWVAQEHHQDGELHLHALGIGYRKLDTRDCRYFDLDGYHPQFKPCKNIAAAKQYLRKEDSTVLIFEEDHFDVWKEVVKNGKTGSEIENLLKEHAPRQFVTQYKAIQSYIRSKETSLASNAIPLWEGWKISNISTTMQEWMSQVNSKPQRCWLLIVIGAALLGKTTWARSIGPHNYMRGTWNVNHLSKDALYTVLDDLGADLNITFFEQKRALLLGMGEATYTDKYKGKKDYDSLGKPCVILLNHLDSQLEYWLRMDLAWQSVVKVENTNLPLVAATES